ncbi:MAG TPA: UDP-N-acetylmuramoyl-L-alanyl-D-glutamate--2,6-diaminopimelate ligase [Candidatus Pacearchaeota archaeon]|nr:UDP-N-acetylmuramoyl-L-alanyl-D-glutamate--2,6-diaminopimelate ligase [Candidatus Pacearchaeota archaeon]
MKIKKYIPKFIFKLYHYFLAFLGALIYGFPSSKLKVIGITGTNGKSTTANICFKVLEKAGFKVALASSISFKIANEEKVNDLKMTMPGRFKIQQFLKEAILKKCDYAIIEVTSEGIEQFRHKFINFDIAIFTNLSKEHIESHGGFDNYKEAKGKFFKEVKGIHILNKDDPYFEYFNSFKANKKITYSILDNADVQAKNILTDGNHSEFEIKDVKFNTKLLGEFNIYNIMAAIALGLSQGIDLEICKKGIEKVEGIPGRMQKIIEEPFSVFIDYAFTPNALEKVYKYLNPTIAVLGACGGGRDKWKRPVLGELAHKYAKYIIITNEDPYDEDPQKIIDEVGEKAPNCIKIFDRREAINKALSLAKKGDTVIITGKGSETCIMWKNGKREDWNEKQVILEEFEKIKKGI